MENLIQRYTNSKKGGYDDRYNSYRSDRGGYDNDRYNSYRSNRGGYDDRHNSYRSNNSRRSSYSRGGSRDILDDVRDATSSSREILSPGFSEGRYATYFANNTDKAIKVLKKYYKMLPEERFSKINKDFDLRDLYLGALNAEYVGNLQYDEGKPKQTYKQIKSRINLEFEKMINSYLEYKFRETKNKNLLKTIGIGIPEVNVEEEAARRRARFGFGLKTEQQNLISAYGVNRGMNANQIQEMLFINAYYGYQRHFFENSAGYYEGYRVKRARAS
jgi:hypothetical protein